MWESQKEILSSEVHKYKIRQEGVLLTFKDWIQTVKESDDFIQFFLEIFTNSPFVGYFWEVRAVNRSGLEEDFEFVLVKSSTLPDIDANFNAFQSYFKNQEAVVSFPNLGGDAQLVVPGKIGEAANYAHLAVFVRNAPESQVIEFWKKVAEEYGKAIGEHTNWLSTAGLGIYWLHVRIDSRPKYYRHWDYKSL